MGVWCLGTGVSINPEIKLVGPHRFADPLKGGTSNRVPFQPYRVVFQRRCIRGCLRYLPPSFRRQQNWVLPPSSSRRSQVPSISPRPLGLACNRNDWVRRPPWVFIFISQLNRPSIDTQESLLSLLWTPSGHQALRVHHFDDNLSLAGTCE